MDISKQIDTGVDTPETDLANGLTMSSQAASRLGGTPLLPVASVNVV